MFQGLRLTGIGGRDYVLGDGIEVYDGESLIGRVQSVRLSPDGAEVLIENFIQMRFEDFRVGALPRLVLAEVVNFIVERHPGIHLVGIELSRHIPEFQGREALLTSIRSEILASIGAQDVHVTPRPQAGEKGSFAVTGIWRYDSASVAVLAATLRTQREAYGAIRNAPPANARRRLARLLPGKT
ncbi:hypothetical protein QTI27_33850 [Variovorax sp. J31P216]|nr:hypothetical protein [Variovorax sp. J31P216]